MSETTTVLIIAPPGRLRDGLRVLLRASAQVAHTAQVDDLASGMQWIAQVQPDLVLLDADLLDEQGWQAIRQIRQGWPQCRCVALTHTTRQEQLARASEAAAILSDGFSSKALFDIIAQQKGLEKGNH
jgi:DNA-binding NarL/FixJ family response regulator